MPLVELRFMVLAQSPLKQSPCTPRLYLPRSLFMHWFLIWIPALGKMEIQYGQGYIWVWQRGGQIMLFSGDFLLSFQQKWHFQQQIITLAMNRFQILATTSHLQIKRINSKSASGNTEMFCTQGSLGLVLQCFSQKSPLQRGSCLVGPREGDWLCNVLVGLGALGRPGGHFHRTRKAGKDL